MERDIIHIALVDIFRDRSREEKRLTGGTGKMLWRRGSIIAGCLNFSCNPTTILAHHVSPEYKKSSKQF